MTTEQPKTHLDVTQALLSLAQQERLGATIPVSIGPLTAYMLISVLQLTQTHPQLSGEMKATMRTLGDQLGQAFQGSHLEENITQGWDRAYDQ